MDKLYLTTATKGNKIIQEIISAKTKGKAKAELARKYNIDFLRVRTRLAKENTSQT